MRLRAIALAACFAALIPVCAAQSAAAEPAKADVSLAGPARATVDGVAVVALTLGLSLQGVSCLDDGKAVVHLMVANAEGYDAELDEDTRTFLIPAGDWTARAYRASVGVNLTVRGTADAGEARVAAWIAPEDVQGCVALMGLRGDRSDHEVALSAKGRASTPPPAPREAPAPPAPPARPADAPQNAAPDESLGEGTRTRPIALRPEGPPGPVILLLVVAAGGLFAVIMQRRGQAV